MTIATDLERYMLGLINEERAAHGLAPLQLEQNLNASADAHSQWMTDADIFSHDGAGGSTATERMLAAGMDLSGSWATAENIAAVSVRGAPGYYDEVDQLHQNLMDSAGHRANILDPDLEYIGIGIAIGPLTYRDQNGNPVGVYSSVLVTQNFARTEGVADLDLGSGGAQGPDPIEGTAGADLLEGTAEADLLDGLGGDDVLLGSGAGDTLMGGAGDDVLIGGDLGYFGLDISGQVYRLFNAVFGREPGIAGHQSWSTQLASGAMTLDQVAEAFMAGPEFQTTYGGVTDTEFVTLLFQNIFGRDPAQAGLEAWTNNLADGMSRAEVLLNFAQGREHQTLTDAALDAFEAAHDPTVYAPQIYRLFEAVFGREPTEAGFEGWVDNLADGMSFEEAVTAFMATPEFTSVYGAATDVQFITTLFTNVLGRPPAQAGLDAWVANLAGGMSREEVVQRFVDGPEFIAKTAADMKAFMLGLGADDRLEPGEGDSILSGGLGSDTFVFTAAGDGTHVITDLEPWDFVALDEFGYADVAALRTNLSQVGEDVVFSDQGVTVIFEDTTLGQITDDQFTF